MTSIIEKHNNSAINRYFKNSFSWINAYDDIAWYYRNNPNDINYIVPYIIEAINCFYTLYFHVLTDKEKETLFIKIKNRMILEFNKEKEDDPDYKSEYESDGDGEEIFVPLE